MIYPDFLKKGDTIAVTAPSRGCSCDSDKKRLDFAKKKFESLGFKVIETPNCRTCELGRSSSGEERGRQFNELVRNKDVKAIICISGGDFLVEALPYIDFNLLKKNPKWIQGYSDPTGLLFPIATNLDMATIYGYNFKSFAMDPMHTSIKYGLDLLTGKSKSFNSFGKYESERGDYITGKEPFRLNKRVKWINLTGQKEIKIKGRIIGGCIDVLDFIIGTKYDGTSKFIEKYKNDGIIWFFDNFDLDCEDIIRWMWRFKELGYFKYTKGIIFGRTGTDKSYYGYRLKDALMGALSSLNVPIIMDADIGHYLPTIPIINGAMAQIISKDGKGEVKFWTK